MLSFVSLRKPTLADVRRALDSRACKGWPQDEDDLIEIFNFLLEDILIVNRDGMVFDADKVGQTSPTPVDDFD